MDGEDGYSTDERKRKADERGDVIFKQSKKTHRSPHKTAEEIKLDQLIEMVKEIKTDQIFRNKRRNSTNKNGSNIHKRRNSTNKKRAVAF
ncbi:hypothetical protein QE152_g27541 [Popillia japonica]|uniref:Uncharacterized protein n=1 Tax=Popillia japonica TaxID=7064 RepID=A0AAW1JV31_POPJA